MEQDFGSMEGKKWDQVNKDTKGFVNVESKEVMAQRADSFLSEHLMPLLEDSVTSDDLVIAVVSHGIFLSTLWKRPLKRLPPKSVSLCLDAPTAPRPSLEHFGGWSNTGYLGLHMTKVVVERPSPLPEAITESMPQSVSSLAETLAVDDGTGKVEVLQASSSENVIIEPPVISTSVMVAPLTAPSSTTHEWTTVILTINGKDHLKGLKRTGGGVGSSRHDASQKSIDTFFKRRKID